MRHVPGQIRVSSIPTPSVSTVDRGSSSQLPGRGTDDAKTGPDELVCLPGPRRPHTQTRVDIDPVTLLETQTSRTPCRSTFTGHGDRHASPRDPPHLGPPDIDHPRLDDVPSLGRPFFRGYSPQGSIPIRPYVDVTLLSTSLPTLQLSVTLSPFYYFRSEYFRYPLSDSSDATVIPVQSQVKL